MLYKCRLQTHPLFMLRKEMKKHFLSIFYKKNITFKWVMKIFTQVAREYEAL